MDIEKIVAEMPKAENPYPDHKDVWGAHNDATEAQCQLLAEQGWRKVPEEQIIKNLTKTIIEDWYSYYKDSGVLLSRFIAKRLHRWLLERDSAGA